MAAIGLAQAREKFFLHGPKPARHRTGLPPRFLLTGSGPKLTCWHGQFAVQVVVLPTI